MTGVFRGGVRVRISLVATTNRRIRHASDRARAATATQIASFPARAASAIASTDCVSLRQDTARQSLEERSEALAVELLLLERIGVDAVEAARVD